MRYVLITKQPDDRYTARALALPELIPTGTTEQEAVEKLKEAVAAMQSNSHVVQVELPLPVEPVDNPWLRYAGMWKDDPDWDAFQEEMLAYRKQIDAKFDPK